MSRIAARVTAACDAAAGHRVRGVRTLIGAVPGGVSK